ncbi:phosphodiester glycosidase family protein [Isoptericola sp. 4D.3]|uniref:Phosphodiester glycosidase family protein n=1 Tax=Isoptericola peretonis TaxID=2918523 RepID=A0ABT0J451_9MICO|nr:phosphodiester glycosidase family protein [Isoptericola sp. 4D.3]
MSRALPPARRTVPAGVGLLLGLALAAPPGVAVAVPPEDGPELPVATAGVAPVEATTVLDDVADLPLDDAGAAIVTERTERLVAPGLELTEFARVSADGWLSGEVLVAHLGRDDGPRLGYLGPDAVAGSATVSEMAAGRGAVAAINGDFFDINNSGAALGAAVDEGTLLKSATPGREKALTVDASGVARLAELFLEGTVSFGTGAAAGGQELPVAGLNVTAVPAGGVAVFDSAWGDASRTRPLGAGEQGVEVRVRSSADGTTGTVVAVGTPGTGRLPADVRAVVARPGAAADALAALAPGDEVTLAYGLRDDLGDIRTAIGGDPDDWLLEDGEVTSATSDFARLRHPRTAVGLSADGTTAYLVVVDGRQAHSVGASLPELGRFLGQLGADDAINLDGGGSTTMVARLPGDARTSVLNDPSDGGERLDANGLGLFTPEGSGEVHAFNVRAAVPTGDAPHADAWRVFPGLHRTLTAAGFDEARAPVDTLPDEWTTTRPGTATVARTGDGAGVVTGVAPGSTTVRAVAPASGGVATGAADVTVLGELERLTVPEPVVTLPDAGATGRLTVVGHDAQGYSAPVEARDVEVTGGEGVAALEPAADGSFAVRALQASGAATFTLAVGDERVEVAVAVSLEDVVVADLADADRWASAHDRAPGGSVGPADGHDGAAGLRLTYDFTRSTATRGQYAVAPDGGVEIPGQPRKVTAWVHGDGRGAWLRLQVRQGDGVVTNLDGPTVSWEGWRQVEVTVPEGVAFPLTLQRLRLLETRAAEQYAGEVVVSDLRAQVPPDVDAPQAERVEDPVVVAEGATDAAPLRVAVMSDAQFVARDPGSGAVAGAKQALAEIVAADPDLLVINGDLVDEASPADFDLAREVLDDGLAGAGFPWYYLPGNHEVMGGSIENFEAEFGERTHVVDVPDPRGGDGGTTRLVMLDSSSGRLGSDFAQLRALREALDDAAADDDVTGVVTLFHHPIDDPLPTKASQLVDRVEAETLRGWFEEFRESSGKGIASVGSHVGVFHAGTEDGVPYVVNGNSGKSPASTPADGGFTGWSMIGVDPAADGAGDGGWFSWEVEARAERVAVSGPEELAVGTSGQVSALLTQDGTREVPVAWPVSSRWGGDGVFVGAPEDAPSGAVLALDPRTHEATAVAPGRATVEVEVNGVVGALDVLVPAGAPGTARISDDNGWDTGLHDGDYRVLVDLWWGENATSLRLYSGGELIHTERLEHGGTEAQRVAVPVTGNVNGEYEYTCELVNAAGTTPCAAPHTVRVTDANPGTPTLSHGNGSDDVPGDGDYVVSMHKWWGTQATGYVLYEDGVEVDRQQLVPGTGGDAQSAATVLTGRQPGTHRYVAVLTNAAGETRSKELTVRVRR